MWINSRDLSAFQQRIRKFGLTGIMPRSSPHKALSRWRKDGFDIYDSIHLVANRWILPHLCTISLIRCLAHNIVNQKSKEKMLLWLKWRYTKYNRRFSTDIWLYLCIFPQSLIVWLWSPSSRTYFKPINKKSEAFLCFVTSTHYQVTKHCGTASIVHLPYEMNVKRTSIQENDS